MDSLIFFFKPVFFNLGTIDIRGWMFSVLGTLCIMGSSAPQGQIQPLDC